LYERLVAYGGKGVSVRQLGGNRAGEMRIARFLHNPKVAVGEMMTAALERNLRPGRWRMCWRYRTLRLCAWMRKARVCPFIPSLRVDATRGRSLA